MSKYSVITIIFVLILSACGVRNEEPLEGATTSVASTSSVSTSSSSVTGSISDTFSSLQNTNPDKLANDEQVEGRGLVVKLRFKDEYTGFWKNETREDSQTTEIMRITYGVDKYHIEYFYDQSSGSNALMQNCYIRSGHTQRDKSAEGLWFVLNNTNGSGDPVYTEDGWVLAGDKLEYTYFSNGVAKDFLARTYSEAFNGLSVDGLQICGSDDE